MVVHMLRLLVCQLRCSTSLDHCAPLVPDLSQLGRELAKQCEGRGTLCVKHLEVASFSRCLDANERLSMQQGRLGFKKGAAPAGDQRVSQTGKPYAMAFRCGLCEAHCA